MEGDNTMKLGLLNTVPSIFDDFDQIFSTNSFDYFMDEDATSYNLSLDLPGIKKEDLQIEVKGQMLIIKAESKGKKSRKYHRAFSMPNTVDMDKTEADLTNGVLTLRMLKIEEKPKLIQIK